MFCGFFFTSFGGQKFDVSIFVNERRWLAIVSKETVVRRWGSEPRKFGLSTKFMFVDNVN